MVHRSGRITVSLFLSILILAALVIVINDPAGANP
jgi:hypothetical protein